MDGNIWLIIKILPLLLASMVIAGFIGWYLRCKLGKCHGHQTVVTESSKSDDSVRYKKLQERFHKVESEYKSARTELEALQQKSVSKSQHELMLQEAGDVQKALDLEKNRAAALDADLKKAQETIGAFHAKANADVKEQKDRTFVLENELSKAREELQRFKGAGDDSEALRKELARAQEVAANATRYAGESRKREAALSEEVEDLKAKLASRPAAVAVVPTPQRVVSSAPAVDSDAVIKARAEVARLNEEKAKAERLAAEQAAIAEAEAIKAEAIKAEAIRVAAEKAALAKALAEKEAAEKEAAEKEAAEKEAAEKEAAEKEAAEKALAVDEAPATAEAALFTMVGAPETGAKIELATEILGKRVRQDDLKIIEGIGPKIEELLQAGGLTTWALLAEASVERVQEILTAAGDAYAVHNPATWPRQAALAAQGQWSELRTWQDELDGGKEQA